MAFMSWFRKNSICVIVKHNWQGCPITVCTFWVPCCDVRYDFRIKTMFGSSLPPVVCRRAHVLFTLFVFVCAVMVNTYCVVFLFYFLHRVYPIVQFIWIVHFFIAPSVFFNIYCNKAWHSVFSSTPFFLLFSTSAVSSVILLRHYINRLVTKQNYANA